MAYLKREEAKTEQQAQPSLLGGGSSFMGQGAAQGADTTKSTAGTPGGWTNIQSYLGANPGAGQETAEQIKGQAEGKISDVQKSIGGVQYNAPTTQGFDRGTVADYLKSGTGMESIQSGLNQQFTAPDIDQMYGTAQGKLGSLQEQAKDVKPGSFQGIMNMFGVTRPESKYYTPGMQKLDTLFLQNVPGFADQFPKEFQEKLGGLQTEMTAAKDKTKGQVETARGATEKARGDWQKGIKDYLDYADEMIKNQQQVQQLGYESELGKKESALAGMSPDERAMAQRLDVDPLQFASYSGKAPDLESAALAYLGQEGFGRYNTLANLADQQHLGKYLGTSEGYKPGQWNFDQGAYEQAIGRAGVGGAIGGLGDISQLGSLGYTPNLSQEQYEDLRRMIG